MKNFDHDFTLPPFPAFPCVSRYVAVGPVADSLGRVIRSIQAKEAISLVIGPPGTGKSLVCTLVAQRFVETHDVVVLGETALADPTAFQRALLHRMGVAMETNVPNDLRLLIEQRLTGPDANPRGVVLVVDEAASLSEEVLECIRRITNIMRDNQPVVSAMLAGGVKLDETLTSPRLESFVQRVTARCYLHPLNAGETRQYIRDCIEACGASAEDTISDAAISAIHHATGGVTRLVNQMMTESIDCAAEMDQTLIDEQIVDKAWAQLQQLPGPMIEEPKIESHSSAVEFGALSDLDSVDHCDQVAEAPELAIEEPRHTIEFSQMAEVEDVEEPRMPTAEENLAESFGYVSEELAELDGMETESPASLFGQFDDEEEIRVGSSEVTDTARHSANLALESMLHSEIISLSHFAAENTDVHEELAAPLEMPESVEMDPMGEQALSSHGNDAPNVVWYDEPDAEPQVPIHKDDSDLLWITEDIDVDRRDRNPTPSVVPTRVDSASDPEAPKLNVDYRELLAKMRNQS